MEHLPGLPDRHTAPDPNAAGCAHQTRPLPHTAAALTLGPAEALLWLTLAGAVLAALTIGILSWCFPTTLAVRAEGVLVPAELRQVRAPAAAVVQRVLVRQGQRVHAGQPLAELQAAVPPGRGSLGGPWRMALPAPSDGVVLTDRPERRVGDRLQAGEVLLETAPLDQWAAEVLVAERDLDRVRPGQEVRLFVQGWPSLEGEALRGQVESVSPVPVAPGQSRATVRLDDPAVATAGRVQRLAYGMRVQARITVARGRIAQLLWRRLLLPFGSHGPAGVHSAGES